MKTQYFFLAIILMAISCAPKEEHDLITVDGLTYHIKNLGSDEFMGRMPFTEGEEITVNYIRDEFEKLGLEPGNGDSYFQDVPMVELTATNVSAMDIGAAGTTISLNYKDDFVALTRQVVDTINIENTEIVFAGFGIVAPEYNWNDYDGLDVTDKVVMVLVNDPGFSTGDPDFFKGEAMTYYGRWTYKYEEAARQGAAGVIIIHDTKPASYPWSVVRNGWSGANLYLEAEDRNMSRCEFEGWVSNEAAKSIFALAGKQDYDFTKESVSQDFTGFSLNLNLSLSFENISKSSTSKNVAGLLRGTEKPDEAIIYAGHWDHFGIGAVVDGDSIFNGAIDNASGIASIMEVAHAFTHQETAPKRSVLFLAVTAEEQGLLGSEYYATHPIFEPSKTVAVINIDALNAFGPMKDLTIVGYGQSELEDIAGVFAEEQGRYLSPDPNPGAGSFFRSDHFNFAKVGIPALYAKGEKEHMTEGEAYVTELNEEYTANHYHRQSDNYDPNWDLGGMIQDTEIFFKVGEKLANDTTLWPEWKEGSEFKALR